ncbi:MAG: AAA family ATPase [Gammaproteobacteria bacterium]|nr:MAG: AAA family ATPase [Gammaproteobacteria bacterium]
MDSRTNCTRLIETASKVVLGKEHEIKLALCCLLAEGHLLIEDLPGVGKTTLSHTLAKLLGLDFRRIQFTSDLMPSDILGYSQFDPRTKLLNFQPGPVFTQLILADEINRASPKTQSALLETMEEKQVTVEGKSWPLPSPFFVIATQNPFSQIGTFPLPESQLDRFLMCLQLGYPNAEAERNLLLNTDRSALLELLPVRLNSDELKDAQNEVAQTHVSEALLDYLQAIIRFTREHTGYTTGLSPRAGVALLRASKAWAWLDNRDAVLPEDIQAVLLPVAAHRLRADPTQSREQIIDPILKDVAIPA